MLFAYDCNDKRVHINKTQSNQIYYCPFCGVPLITRKGEIRQHHFSHSANHPCSDSWERSGNYDMSPWHNEWQSLFPDDNQEILLSLGETKHRADVLIGRTVIEFQHSIMPVKSFDDRNNFYFNLGYKVVWLFDLSDIYSSGALKEYDRSERLLFIWDNPKKAFNSYDVNSGCIDLFFQLSNDNRDKKIVRVLDVSEYGFEQFETTRFMSKEEFLNYVGLVNGCCASPERDDINANEKYLEFCKKYNISLNKQQARAVLAVEGSNLLLAVPGSGKTTVLITRLGHMVINKGIDPRNILAVTFTKKAAEEMRERFNKKFGSIYSSRICFSTINALCNRIYRRYCQNKETMPRTQLEDNRPILYRVLRSFSSEYPTESDILELQQTISYIKNMMLNGSEIKFLDKKYDNISAMFEAYQTELEKNNQMDFDDQMLFTLDILNQNPDILSALRSKYKYISVDEAQDTSKIQHTIIKLLANGNNLFMVGDEDQSIYGFRAAYPKALLNFRYDYNNPYILRMERNYRSTEQIVDKAQLFISKNKGRYEKHMISDRGKGEEVHIVDVNDREEQYNYLLNVALGSKKETAFLYRDNESSVVLVDLLLRNNIPFKLRTPEMNFFNNKVVRDIIAYLKLATDENDYKSLERICNHGIFYLKKQQLTYAINDCKNKKMSVFDAIEEQMQYVNTKQQNRADSFKRIINTVSSLTPYKAINYLLDKGYRNYIEENHCDFGKAELLQILAKNEESIHSYISRLQFLEGQILKGFDTSNNITLTLSTIHSSKGLEYDTVYMVDVYDGRFPSSMPNIFNTSKDSSDGEMEERRLFYVGITRAKNALYLFNIKQKYSSYVEELFPELSTARNKNERQNVFESEKLNQKMQKKKKTEQEEIRKRELEKREAIRSSTEERLRKKKEELEKRQAEDEEKHRREVLDKIDQQEEPARDSLGKRWVRCEQCGKIKKEGEFSYYGGLNRANLGVCTSCARAKR